MLILGIISMILFSGPERPENASRVHESQVYFRWDKSNYEDNYRSNSQAADKVYNLMKDIGTERVDSVIVKAYASPEGAVSTDNIDSNTKITIEKIEIKGTFAPSGTLNLNNTEANKALWTPATAAETTLTIPNTDMAASLKATVNGETSFPSITGVTNANVNVFTGAAPAKTDATYYTFIPTTTSTTLNVKITYYVTTQDAKLDGGLSCVKNVIDKDITFTGGFACGLNYNLNIVLGMTTVKLEATVSDWADPSNVDIDLPVNL